MNENHTNTQRITDKHVCLFQNKKAKKKAVEMRRTVVDLHGNRNVYGSDVPSQRRCRLGPVAPLAPVLGPLPAPLLLAGPAALPCGGVAVVVLVPRLHAVLGGGGGGGGGGGLAGRGRRRAGGDGGVGR